MAWQLPAGGLANGEKESPGDVHIVQESESVAGYVIYEKSTGPSKKLMEIQNIAARTESSAAASEQKFITLGYMTHTKAYVPLKSQQQLNDTQAWVTYDGKAKVRARKIYCRVEDPTLAAKIYLVFSLIEVKR